MATTLVIEEESGTSRGLYHPHNGYWAGDFSRTPVAVPAEGRSADYYAVASGRRRS